MIEPDFMYETQVAVPLDEATENLSQNLHLKWNYALLYVDRYTNERDIPVSIISGLRKQGESTLYHMRVTLTSHQKGTTVNVHIWHVMTSGYPFPTKMLSVMGSDKDAGVDIADDILTFCAVPFEDTGSVFSWLRNMFNKKPASRDYS